MTIEGMSNAQTEKILSRVRKMLKLANDKGATEGERDNAMRMAHATLAKYNLEMAAVEAADPASGVRHAEPVEPRIQHDVAFGGWPWARNICASIAKLFFCEHLYVPNSNVWKVRHYFIGKYSNAVTAALISEFVVTSVIREGLKLQKLRHENNAFVRSFGWGAAHHVRDRVYRLMNDRDQLAPDVGDDLSKAPDHTATSTALVLASLYETEAAANKQLVTALFGAKTYERKGRAGAGADRLDGYAAGHEYGGRVSLNPQVR